MKTLEKTSLTFNQYESIVSLIPLPELERVASELDIPFRAYNGTIYTNIYNRIANETWLTDVMTKWQREYPHIFMNLNFLKEWQPYDKMNKKVERAILNHFMKHTYTWQPTHEESSKRPFKPVKTA